MWRNASYYRNSVLSCIHEQMQSPCTHKHNIELEITDDSQQQ